MYHFVMVSDWKFNIMVDIFLEYKMTTFDETESVHIHFSPFRLLHGKVFAHSRQKIGKQEIIRSA